MIGGFAQDHYWSSTEDDSNLAWLQLFNGGSMSTANKANKYRVRAVRAF